MDKPNASMARQVARAASVFQQQRTGHAPQAVTVVLSDDTLLVTLHGALSPAEQSLSRSPTGAAQVQEYHRQLFKNSLDVLREEIKRITGAQENQTTSMTATHQLTFDQVASVYRLEEEPD